MSGKPYSNFALQTIQKIKKQYAGMKENIQFASVEQSPQNKWLSQIPYFKQLSFHHSVCIALWDVRHSYFSFAIDERKVTQYDTSLYTAENGLDFSLSNFHPDHLYAVHLINQCANECVAANLHIPVDKILINVDALYRINSGNYIHILQQIVPVETDGSGRPYLFLSYIRDITHLKKQPSAGFIFTTPEISLYWKYSVADKQLEKITPFTPQEKKVLGLLSEGKQTRQMAEVLSLSPHTINTHRRRMLAKTNCIDSTALVAYCQMIGLL